MSSSVRQDIQKNETTLLRSEPNSIDAVLRFGLAETFKQQLVNEATTRERHKVQKIPRTQGSLLIPIGLHAVRVVLRTTFHHTSAEESNTPCGDEMCPICVPCDLHRLKP